MVTWKDLIKTGLFFKCNLNKNVSGMAEDQYNRGQTVGKFTSDIGTAEPPNWNREFSARMNVTTHLHFHTAPQPRVRITAVSNIPTFMH
jgi:hypothetical protein